MDSQNQYDQGNQPNPDAVPQPTFNNPPPPVPLNQVPGYTAQPVAPVQPAQQYVEPPLEQPAVNQQPQYQQTDQQLSQSTILSNIKLPQGEVLELVFRYGLASMLLINGIVAFVEPESFKVLLEDNLIGGKLPSIVLDGMVVFAGINDIILAALILANWNKSLIYAWLGVWFAAIASVKAMNLVI